MLADGWWQEISGKEKRDGGGWLGLHVEQPRLRIRAVLGAKWARK